MTALARHVGCRVTAVHVRHGLRDDAADERCAAETAASLDVQFRSIHAQLVDGPNLEERARDVRYAALPAGVLTGHTADDQAETVLLALLRGSGASGLSAIEPNARRPILRLRRAETRALCDALGLAFVDDPSNDDPRFRRNRVRHELVPLLTDIGERDPATILGRTADLLRDDDRLLDELAADIDPTDARSLAAAPLALARRAIRRWLLLDGHPPGAAAVARVLDVAAGRARAGEIEGGRRIE
ncbi:MAG: tRNA lysidine(34) synthetase TilS, partial [Acidimicrobiia bacterium]|nr:tRNA lysidine(34) synthetase TilS [Acidimicrobiia bacterium]